MLAQETAPLTSSFLWLIAVLCHTPEKEERQEKAEMQIFRIDILGLEGSGDSTHTKYRSTRALLCAPILLEFKCVFTLDVVQSIPARARWTCEWKPFLPLLPHSLGLHFLKRPLS